VKSNLSHGEKGLTLPIT